MASLAIGLRHVEGADHVAERIFSLCCFDPTPQAPPVSVFLDSKYPPDPSGVWEVPLVTDGGSQGGGT